MNENGLDQLETELCDRLLADPWFAQSRQLEDLSYVTIPCIPEEAGDLDTLIAKAIAELGICVTIKVVGARVKHTELGGPFFDPIEIVVLVVENVLLNRGTSEAPSATGTLKSAKATALRAGFLLSLFQPDSLTCKLTTPENAEALKQVSDEGGIVQYNYRLQARGGLSLTLPQVALPQFTYDGGAEAWLITCATAGAAIFWTNDGRHPSPRAGSFFDPNDPQAWPAGSIIKARAWLAGYQTSAIANLEVPA